VIRRAGEQSGFDALLADADDANRARVFEREAGHLPATMVEALPFYLDLINRHHAAMLAGDVEATMALREDAHRLALRLNKGAPGILADEDAPGCKLSVLTAATQGDIPLWGQSGSFMVNVGAMCVRIEIDGMFGIGSTCGFWPGFGAHIVNVDQPFFSETGYRSFLGLQAQPAAGMMPESFAASVIAAHITNERKPKRRADF